jgi:sugar fermentation stimulation protein A
MDKPHVSFGPLVPGVFKRRDNRFRVQVQVADHLDAAHLPNSGRLGELLVPGRRVWLAPADLRRKPHRRTAYDLALVEYQGRLVSVDARLPGRLIAEALRRGQLAGFDGYSAVHSEVRFGDSRLDFRLDAGAQGSNCWIEVKSVTLVEEGIARFPDAPTLRGQRHLRELMHAVQQGERAAAMFVVQRDDAHAFAPHDQADPVFGQTLRQAARAGVEVYAWRCRVTLEGTALMDTIPLIL